MGLHCVLALVGIRKCSVTGELAFIERAFAWEKASLSAYIWHAKEIRFRGLISSFLSKLILFFISSNRIRFESRL